MGLLDRLGVVTPRKPIVRCIYPTIEKGWFAVAYQHQFGGGWETGFAFREDAEEWGNHQKSLGNILAFKVLDSKETDESIEAYWRRINGRL